jgi:SulP family sulfate permease
MTPKKNFDKKNKPLKWLNFFPALKELKDYNLTKFKKDMLAGLTVATYALPQGIAYAAIAGLPPELGLHCAIITCIVGAIFDSSKQLINGPTNALSIATLGIFNSLHIINPNDKIQAAIALSVMIGIIQTTVAILRLGDLTRFISHSVVLGFSIGSGFLLASDQIVNLLQPSGLTHSSEYPIMRLVQAIQDTSQLNFWHIGGALIAIFLAISFYQLKKIKWIQLPELFTSLVITMLFAQIAGLTSNDLPFIKSTSVTLPTFSWPHFIGRDDLKLLKGAFIVGILGLLEAVSMAKSISAQTHQKLDANQQCLSEGLANLTGGFFGCMPGSGSLSRSMINLQAGASTQWSGVMSALVVACFTVWGSGFIAMIPKAALTGLLIFIALKLIYQKQAYLNFKATKLDAITMTVTATSCYFISVESSILIGICLSFIMFVKRASKVQLVEIVRTNKGYLKQKHNYGPDHPHPQTLFYSIEGELFFGSAEDLSEHFKKIEDDCLENNSKCTIVRLKYAMNPDAVSIEIIKHFLLKMESLGIMVFFCGVSKEMMKIINRTGLSEIISKDQLFMRGGAPWGSAEAAWLASQKWLEKNNSKESRIAV